MKGSVEAYERFVCQHDREPTDEEMTSFLADEWAYKVDQYNDRIRDMDCTETTKETK